MGIIRIKIFSLFILRKGGKTRDYKTRVFTYMNKKSILSGAMILGIGTFIAKILGALYRIPLTGILGGSGLGLYQLVFPVYVLLLDFSGAGAPNAIAKIISSNEVDKENYSKRILGVSIIAFTVLGTIFSLLTVVFSRAISIAQGNLEARLAYVLLAPAVVFVCVLSCFRGYFQGLKMMFPTALSQIVEQAVKLILGLFLARFFLPNIPLAVGGAVTAITISEAVALLVVYLIYIKRGKGKIFNGISFKFFDELKKVLKVAIPVSLIGIILPFSQVIDSFIIVNGLKEYSVNATALYGIFSGAVLTVINLPVSLCYGISTVTIPFVASSKTHAEREKNQLKALYVTLGVSVICAIFCYIFSPFIVNMLYGRLPLWEKELCINLLRFTSPVIVLLCMLQTLNAVMIATNKAYRSIINIAVGVAFKIIVNVLLIKKPNINVYGCAVALIVCYFSADLLNLISLRFSKRYESKRTCIKKLNIT